LAPKPLIFGACALTFLHNSIYAPTMFGDRLEEGLTFDDVLVVPSLSRVLPRDVDIRTRLTSEIELATPVISAAMDTVTEASTAIAMAQDGGLGIIHKNWPAERHAEEVARVKKFESGVVAEPITVEPGFNLARVRELSRQHRISGFPVTQGGRLVGIITRRDLQFENDPGRKVSEIMTPRERLVTAPSGVSLKEAKSVLHRHRIEKLPLVDAQDNLAGLITVRDIETEELHPNATKDDKGRLRVGAAISVGESEYRRAGALLEAGADVLVVDTAHGHSVGVIEMVGRLRKDFPDLQIIAGNIGTAEAARALIEAGASAVKVGVGPGSICTTRIVAGCGVPQITAISNVASVARKKGVPVIADGGVKFSGDLVKALAAGAHVVMVGSLMAGTQESPGEVVLYQGRSYKVYRGMGSITAMEQGSRDRYAQGEIEDPRKLVPEGIEGRVPYRGRLRDVLYQLIGGLRAGMGYAGCATIEELSTKTKFMRITSAGLRASHVHGVIITKEAPNYSVE
jgi:IMP dehydrogenase